VLLFGPDAYILVDEAIANNLHYVVLAHKSQIIRGETDSFPNGRTDKHTPKSFMGGGAFNTSLKCAMIASY